MQGSGFEFQGRFIETDENGFITSMEDWSEAVCEHLAAVDGCVLTDEHREIIGFVREYYGEHGIAPAVRILVRSMRQRWGADKGNSRYLYRLFPDGPAKQACRYAGLPKPTGCI